MKPPKTALICGGAKCVFDDIAAANELFVPDSIFAVNDVGTVLKRVDFFITVHPTKMPEWMKMRRSNGYPDPLDFWTVMDKPLPLNMKFKRTKNTRGGSGLLAVSVAKYLGFEKIVLAGIPMTREGGHYFNEKTWGECHLYRAVWEKNLTTLLQGVKSMSGWTREKLGSPTSEWLRLQEPIG